ERIQIKKGSELEKLVREVERHEVTAAVAKHKAMVAAVAPAGRRSKVDVPDWLKAHYLRNHPEARVAALAAPEDPTEGLPMALESLYEWMLLPQDLRPTEPRAAAAAAPTIT